MLLRFVYFAFCAAVRQRTAVRMMRISSLRRASSNASVNLVRVKETGMENGGETMSRWDSLRIDDGR